MAVLQAVTLIMSGISARPQLTPTSQSNWWKKVKRLFSEGVHVFTGRIRE